MPSCWPCRARSLADVEPAADAELELAEAVDTEAPEDRAPETEALPDEAPLEDAVEVVRSVEAAQEAVAELELLAADPVADPDAAGMSSNREVVDARVLAIAVAVDAVEAPTVRAVEPDARAEEAALADRDEDARFPPHTRARTLPRWPTSVSSILLGAHRELHEKSQPVAFGMEPRVRNHQRYLQSPLLPAHSALELVDWVARDVRT